MIDYLSEFNFGGVHTTRYLITLPEYLSSDDLYKIVKDVENWIEEAPRKSRKRCVFFEGVYLELLPMYNHTPQAKFGLNLYHKVIKRRSYVKIPDIVDELKGRVESRKPIVLFKHSEAFIDSFLRYCEGQQHGEHDRHT
jgi:hypothetical protein